MKKRKRRTISWAVLMGHEVLDSLLMDGYSNHLIRLDEARTSIS